MPRDPDRAFFGHPSGLMTLFFTEMWERFSYYGMRALLTLFMVAKVTDGGRQMTDGATGVVVGLFLASVYLLALPGGWIADRFLGQRKAVVVGGIGITLGNLLLALPTDSSFYPGLFLIAIGTGFLKPNVSTLVGQLYSKDDIRRDAGFTIYYIGINIGALVAPIACGFLAHSDTFKHFLAGHGIDPRWCWRFAFATASLVMAMGTVQYLLGGKRLGTAGMHPTIPADPVEAKRGVTILWAIAGSLAAVVAIFVGLSLAGIAVSKDLIGNIFGIGLLIGSVVLFYFLVKGARDADEKRRIIAMIPLFIGGIAFFAAFEQASSTLSLFTERFVRRAYLGFKIPATYWQAANSVFVIGVAPIAAWVWLSLARRKKEPSSVNKFGIGMLFTAGSFALLIPTVAGITIIANNLYWGQLTHHEEIMAAATAPHQVSGHYLVGYYLMATFAELCISPVGLSSMSKLAPPRMAGMVMGTWFLAAANGNYLAGRAAGFSEARGYGFLFYTLVIGALVISVALILVAPTIKRMMGPGTSDAGPLEKSEKAEPEPLPRARVVE